MNIPAKTSQYYIREGFTASTGDRYEADKIYNVDPATIPDHAHKLEEVRFPSLSAVTQNIAQKVEAYKEQRQEISESPRYADNPAEREFLLKEISKQLDSDIADLEKKFAQEIELTEMDLAQASVKPIEVKTEDKEAASLVLGTLSAQLAFSSDPASVLRLFEKQVAAVGDGVRIEILKHIANIAESAGSDPASKEILRRIHATCADSHPGMRDFVTRSKHLDAIKRDGDPAAAYRALKAYEARRSGR
ncbi:hypothetical protein LCY76_09410 [Fictibacillus sp. KIGAM418]|uniref:Uncharacterized protein n=1 Tax=Fictibacillus marinisediminis TaxID=2878389 RepID=A0A9X2BCR3_9BACL|nr:hypothetical protein [Fictibacillus marinisediminis]MCK6256811.1 hypothetical protein [Fictibacillus marinisediminis]